MKRTRVTWTVVRALAAMTLAGCFAGDVGAGAPDAGSEGGIGGLGGLGGTSGVGPMFPGECGAGGTSCSGTGAIGGGGSGEPPCPADDPSCTEAEREAACEELLSCDLVTGPAPSFERCVGNIDVGCVRCLNPLGPGGASDAGADDGGAEPEVCFDPDEGTGVGCGEKCNLLAEPPVDQAACKDLALPAYGGDALLSGCVCSKCFDPFARCVQDDDCWLIYQCSARVGCVAVDCAGPDACQDQVEAAGMSSFGFVLFEEISHCQRGACQTLGD